MKQKFSAVIYKQGINPCVDIPERVSLAFQRKGYIPVRGTLDKHPFQATLVPIGKGKYRLFINGKMRKLASVEVGDEIKVELEFDAQKRTIPMPGVRTADFRVMPRWSGSTSASIPSG